MRPVTCCWYKVGYPERGGGGLQLMAEAPRARDSLLLLPRACAARDTEARQRVRSLPRSAAVYLEAAHHGSHTFQVLTRKTSVLRFLSVSHI